MDGGFYLGLIEMLVFFGLVLAFAGWEYYSVSKYDKDKDRDSDER